MFELNTCGASLGQGYQTIPPPFSPPTPDAAKTPMNLALQEIEHSVMRLFDALERLEVRLGPVLIAAAPEASSANGSQMQVPAPRSQMFAIMDAYAARLHTIVQRVNSLSERIDL